MSMFVPITVACPSCGEEVKFEACDSVNADRRPDLRDAILAGTFQRETCELCETAFRLEPTLMYLDIGRNQWLAVHPARELAGWVEIEAQAREAFATAFGEEASGPAREIGAELKPRLVFGWAAFHEKIAANEAGLDDVELELVKIAMLRGMEDAPLAKGTELRFVRIEGGNLLIAWVKSLTEDLVEFLQVPRALYDDIAADRIDWQPIREEVSAGYFVDMQRLLTAPAAAASAGV